MPSKKRGAKSQGAGPAGAAPASKRPAKAKQQDIHPTVWTVDGRTFRVTVPGEGSTDALFQAVEVAAGVAADKQLLVLPGVGATHPTLCHTMPSVLPMLP